MNKESIIAFSDKILRRYEEPLDVIFLYNVQKDTIWAGNSSSIDILNLVDGKHSILEISELLVNNYDNFDYQMVLESVLNVCESLYAKEIIYIIS